MSSIIIKLLLCVLYPHSVIPFILYGVNDGLVPRAPTSFPSFAVWKAMRSWMEDLICVIAHDVGSLDKQEFLLDPDCSMLVISL